MYDAVARPGLDSGQPRAGPYPMGLMVLLATVAMLFAAFTAAVLVRRTGLDWDHVPLPGLAWVNTIMLAASSAALEFARRSLRTGGGLAARWIGVAGWLGVLFLIGQVALWSLLAGRGVFLPSSPHASFIYLLSAVHAAHIVGGIGSLGWVYRRTVQGRYTASHHVGFTHATVYWHFVGVVWLYLLVILATL